MADGVPHVSPDLFFLISKKVSIGIVLLLQIIQMKYVY